MACPLGGGQDAGELFGLQLKALQEHVDRLQVPVAGGCIETADGVVAVGLGVEQDVHRLGVP